MIEENKIKRMDEMKVYLLRILGQSDKLQSAMKSFFPKPNRYNKIDFFSALSELNKEIEFVNKRSDDYVNKNIYSLYSDKKLYTIEKIYDIVQSTRSKQEIPSSEKNIIEKSINEFKKKSWEDSKRYHV